MTGPGREATEGSTQGAQWCPSGAGAPVQVADPHHHHQNPYHHHHKESTTMSSTIRKFAVAVSVCGAAAAAASPSVFAAGAHLSPANTVITGNLLSGTSLTLVGQVDGFPLTVTCTGLTASGKTPAAGLTVKLPTAPKFTGCTDSLTGTDTVTTTGAWSLVANSTGSTLTLKIPVKGATFSSSLLPSCVITVAPTTAGKITGKYDNVNKWTITNSKFPISGAGCTTSATSSATSTVVFSPNVSVVP